MSDQYICYKYSSNKDEIINTIFNGNINIEKIEGLRLSVTKENLLSIESLDTLAMLSKIKIKKI